jgi:hypothetical protein
MEKLAVFSRHYPIRDCHDRRNFEGLVLGCIDADFIK